MTKQLNGTQFLAPPQPERSASLFSSKKYLLNIVFITLLTHFGYAQIQSGTVIYKVKSAHNIEAFLEEVNATARQASAIKRFNKKINKGLPYLTYTLKFTKKEALFSSPAYLKNDNGIDLTFSSRFIGADGIFYTHLIKNIKLHQLHYINRKWLIERKIDSIQWHITDETKKIQGYLCRKATAVFDATFLKKGKITAWFAPSLPFQFGPMNYAGLPGLILGLQQGHWYFYADKINLSKREQNIKPPAHGKRLTIQEYRKETHRLTHKMKYKLKN